MSGCNNNNNKINQVREKAKFYLKSNFPSKLNLSFYCTSIPPCAIIHFAHPCRAALKILHLFYFYFFPSVYGTNIFRACTLLYNLVKQLKGDRCRR